MDKCTGSSDMTEIMLKTAFIVGYLCVFADNSIVVTLTTESEFEKVENIVGKRGKCIFPPYFPRIVKFHFIITTTEKRRKKDV